MFLLAAISLGFLGSFHCIGMCGPIALTIPVKRNSSMSMLGGSLVYNFGRVMTYSFIGLLFGFMGQGFAMAGWQNILSITLGILILLFLLVPKLSFINTSKGLIFKFLESLKSQIRKLFGIHTMSSLLFIGVLITLTKTQIHQ